MGLPCDTYCSIFKISHFLLSACKPCRPCMEKRTEGIWLIPCSNCALIPCTILQGFLVWLFRSLPLFPPLPGQTVCPLVDTRFKESYCRILKVFKQDGLLDPQDPVKCTTFDLSSAGKSFLLYKLGKNQYKWL